MRTFLFSYWFEGHQYSMEVVAKDADEAKRRVFQMQNAKYDGEAFAKISAKRSWFRWPWRTSVKETGE